MAVYIPTTATHNKRHDPKVGGIGHPHRHHHLHRHHKASSNLQQQREALAKRAVGDTVIATIDGQRVSWINSYSGPPAPAPESFPTPNEAENVVFETVIATSFVTVLGPCLATSEGSTSQYTETSAPQHIEASTSRHTEASTLQHTEAPTSTIAVSVPLPTDNDIHATTGSWIREAYYDAGSGHSKGFTFLNHHGDTHGASGTSEGGAP